MKKWHRTDADTGDVELVPAGWVQSAIETQRACSREEAKRLMAAAVTGEQPIKLRTALFEFREVAGENA